MYDTRIYFQLDSFTQMDHPILELNLDSRAVGSIRAALHLWLPDRPEQTIAHDIPVALDLTQLRELSLTNDAYGQALTTMVFADSRLLQGWQEAYKHLIGFSTPIRFRIAYSPDADMLHGLRWELLEDPLSQLHVPLALSERLLFSRFLKVTQYDPPPRRLSHPLRALVIVANPHGLERYNLTPIDGQREVDLVRRALPGIDVTALRSDLGDQPVTLNAIEYSLRTHREVVYLLAHGRLSTSEAALWLESDDGTIDLVKASDIVHMVRGVRPSPLLMVLASCQSAGDDEGGALVALGPQLVLAGVPAVLAMHGTINQSTLEHLLPIFFDRLRRHGQIDEALAAARNFVQRQAHEWWKPVLFLGTHRGRLWSADTLRTANLGPQQPYISQAVTLSSALEDFAQIQPDMLLQIDTEALSVQSVFPIQRNDNVLIYSLRVWDNTLGRNMLVQIFAADSVYEDSQQRLALLCDRIRRHEMAAQQCFQLRRRSRRGPAGRCCPCWP
ncbi:CHAT domain-containing protein [Scytonema tolypothrichoides VB-61278]|nr:CHAT domain-containing protein [Scytonema tolypothrichoides VB-61278]